MVEVICDGPEADDERTLIPWIWNALDGRDCWAGLMCPGDGPAQNSVSEGVSWGRS